MVAEQRHVPPHRVALVAHVEPGDPRGAAVGANGGGEHAQQRRLARAVAARDHHHRARGHAQAHVDQRPAPAVAPAEPDRLDGERASSGQRVTS